MKTGAVIVALASLPVLACGDDPPPAIVVDDRMVHIENQTAEPWTGIEIWVNDHYRAMRASMAPGERLQVPLNVFVAGFGQRFEPTRMKVRGVELTAMSDGLPVRLVWGTGRRRPAAGR
jgi:hypothetical protein